MLCKIFSETFTLMGYVIYHMKIIVVYSFCCCINCLVIIKFTQMNQGFIIFIYNTLRICYKTKILSIISLCFFLHFTFCCICLFAFNLQNFFRNFQIFSFLNFCSMMKILLYDIRCLHISLFLIGIFKPNHSPKLINIFFSFSIS